MVDNLTLPVIHRLSAGTNVIYLAALIIAKWFILEKMREKGWKAIIPFYSEYLIVRNTWKASAFWMQLFSGSMGMIITFVTIVISQNVKPIYVFLGIAVGFALLMANLIINLRVYHRLAMAFGHRVGYTIGLLLFHPLFMLILGLEKNEYLGHQR